MKSSWVLSCVVLIITSNQVIASLYSHNSGVISIDGDAAFRDIVHNDHRNILVEFYAPWCGHCQKLKPEYESAAKKLRGITRLAAVNCDDQVNQGICAQQQIKGFPTIKMFVESEKSGKKYTVDYNGERSTGAIVKFSTSKLQSYVYRLISGKSSSGASKRTKTLDEFLALIGENNSPVSKVLLFTSKLSTSPLYKALSVEYRDRLFFAEIRDSEVEIVEKYGVTEFPTLAVLPHKPVPGQTEAEPIKFNSLMKYEFLVEFLEEYALMTKSGFPTKKRPEKGDKKEEKKEPKEEKKKDDAFDSLADQKLVEILSQHDFEQFCLEKVSTCFLSFISVDPADEEAQRTLPDYLKDIEKVMDSPVTPSDANDKLKSRFRFAWINHARFPSLLQTLGHENELPTVLIVRPRQKAYRPLLTAWTPESILALARDAAHGLGRYLGYPRSMAQKLELGPMSTSNVPENVSTMQNEEGNIAKEQPKPVIVGRDDKETFKEEL